MAPAADMPIHGPHARKGYDGCCTLRWAEGAHAPIRLALIEGLGVSLDDSCVHYGLARCLSASGLDQACDLTISTTGHAPPIVVEMTVAVVPRSG
jgi:hypothetical protein